MPDTEKPKGESEDGAKRAPLNPIALALLVVLVFLTRLPFIGAGYGTDPDSWQVAAAAMATAANGEYVTSRLPGYPVQEITCSFFARGGPLLLNGLTALMSAVGVLFFALFWRRLGGKHPCIAAAAFALVPVYYINSTVTMDYAWALAFILAGFYFALRERPVLAGLFLGLAVGCRITSGAMILPMGIVLSRLRSDRRGISKIALFALSAALFSLVFFAPVLVAYGPGFFRYYQAKNPQLLEVVKGASEDLWGTLGLAAIACALLFEGIGFLLRRGRSAERAAILDSPALLATITAVLLYAALYVKVPYEPAYLLPAVPFALILLGAMLRRRAFIAVCVALAASPFLVSPGRHSTPDQVSVHQWHSDFYIDLPLSGGRYYLDAAGPVIVEHNRRLRMLGYIDSIMSMSDEWRGKPVVALGPWLAALAVSEADNLDGGPADLKRFLEEMNDTSTVQAVIKLTTRENVVFVRRLTAEDIRDYRGRGYRLYYSPDVRTSHLLGEKVDLPAEGVVPLPLPE